MGSGFLSAYYYSKPWCGYWILVSYLKFIRSGVRTDHNFPHRKDGEILWQLLYITLQRTLNPCPHYKIHFPSFAVPWWLTWRHRYPSRKINSFKHTQIRSSPSVLRLWFTKPLKLTPRERWYPICPNFIYWPRNIMGFSSAGNPWQCQFGLFGFHQSFLMGWPSPPIRYAQKIWHWTWVIEPFKWRSVVLYLVAEVVIGFPRGSISPVSYFYLLTRLSRR